MDTIDGIAAVLAEGDPAVWEALLRRHRPDVGGRCGECTSGGGAGRPGWPCRLAEIAGTARRATLPPPITHR